jgi:hypothetical protein
MCSLGLCLLPNPDFSRGYELARQKWAFAMCQREEITEPLDRELSLNYLPI